jgi:cytochrome c biogenesis factor
MSLDGYRVTYLGLHPQPQSNRMVLQTPVLVRRGTRTVGVLRPSQNIYPQVEQPIVTPAVREEPSDMALGLLQGRSPVPDLQALLQGSNPFEDVYVIPVSINNVNATTFRTTGRGSVTMQLMVTPLVGFLWLGGAVIGLGGFVSLVPGRRRRVRVTSSVSVRHREEVPA